MSVRLQMGAVEWGLLLLLSVIWGASFLFGRIAVQELPPMTLVLLRVALAAVAINLWLAWRGGYRGERPWAGLAVLGLVNNVIPFGLIFLGQVEIGAALAAIVNALTPVWSMLFAHWATADERLSANRVGGVVISLAGVAVLIGTSALTGLSAAAWAQVAVLGATLSYGLATVWGRRFAALPPAETARGQLTMSTLLMVPIALVVDRPWTLSMPSGTVWVSVLLLAVVCTAFAYILYFTILQRAGAVNAALVTLLIPPSATLMGIVFLGETLAPHQFAGMGLILAGLVVIDGRLLRRS